MECGRHATEIESDTHTWPIKQPTKPNSKHRPHDVVRSYTPNADLNPKPTAKIPEMRSTTSRSIVNTTGETEPPPTGEGGLKSRNIGNIYRNVDVVVSQDERSVHARQFGFGDGHGRWIETDENPKYQRKLQVADGLSSVENKQLTRGPGELLLLLLLIVLVRAADAVRNATVSDAN